MTEPIARSTTWRYCRIGLIVTGTGERRFLDKLLNRWLAANGDCHFEVVAQIGQRNPITSPKRRAQMVGTGKLIPDRDALEIGAKARAFLQQRRDSFVILIDDLEYARKDSSIAVFNRYRDAMIPMTRAYPNRTSVHFLIFMLEAYYFADSGSMNAVLGTALADFEGDVESIPHPKRNLRNLHPGFDEISHGEKIVQRLDLSHILSRTDTCRSLRTLVGWCWRVMGKTLTDEFQLSRGQYFDVTRSQIDALAPTD